MLKKFIYFAISGCIVILFAGCVGPSGEAFLSYSWTSSPQYFYDENPSTPATVYNGVYFSTNEGTYYMEYTAWDDSSWWMSYTITEEEGSLFWTAGEDTYFEITLYSTGPTLWEWSEEYKGLSSKEPEEDEKNIEATTIKIDTYSEARGLAKLPKEGTESVTEGNYTITIEYGRLEQ